MFSVDIPIPDPQKPPAIQFPPRCVHCGKQPPAESLPLKMPMGVEKRGRQVTLDLKVPLCAEGAKLERGIAKVTLVPFLLGGLLTGLPAFVIVWLLTPENFLRSTTRAAVFADLVLGAFAGLMAGLVGGILIETAFKLLFAPLYGKMLIKRPLTMIEIFSDMENVVGFSAALAKDKKRLQLAFENEDVGREFQRLNSWQKDAPPSATVADIPRKISCLPLMCKFPQARCMTARQAAVGIYIPRHALFQWSPFSPPPLDRMDAGQTGWNLKSTPPTVS
ncbi:MAG: hypothetical protein OHK0041_23670 [Anaerolineales bacterium]